MIINNDFRIFSPQDLTVRKEYRKVYEDASGRYCPLSKGMNSFEGNEEIFRQLIVNINDAFWVMDLVVSRFIYISPAYREIWGRPCQFLYDNPESFKSSIHPKDWSKIKTAMERLCITGEKSEEEYRIIRPDGSVRWIWGRMFPVVDSQNRVYRLVGVAEDITRRKQLEQELRWKR